ncbi:GBF-interacting protein 1-like isoform X2 [Cajanus cajan]|uniref:GBF-interacting protein 1-like isoform X2 n=1 Tax=Cajanus cajan TaxID=3821 RepID=UPI00098DA29C|nr:GBF-interacting protein 1-like isoform X2 [Cajanus cajan]
MSGGGLRGSIPSGVRKTIQNIKEITGNHSEDEIYAMLKECSMDPNETTHKLLLQDTFHEVKRKRDRRKENVNNLESLESRSRPGTKGRGVRGGRGKFSPHQTLHDGLLSDAGDDKNSGISKDSGTNQATEKGVPPPLSASQETRTKEKSSGTSSLPVIANGPTSVAPGTTSGIHVSVSSTRNVDRTSPSSGRNNSLGGAFPADSSLDKGAKNPLGSEPVSSTSDYLGSSPASSSTVCFSSSDPVLVPYSDSRLPGAVGAISCEVGSQRPPGKLNAVNTSDRKSAAALETDSSSFQGKIHGKSRGVAKNHFTEGLSSSTIMQGSSSRPSSNHSNRSQQLTGPQKAGFNKEWKPKSTSTISGGSGSASLSESSAETTGQLQSVSKVVDSGEAASILQRKMEDLHLSPRQHVKLPNHILVPDSEKNKFSFGSLGFTYRGNTSYDSGPENEKSSMPPSEVSQDVEETAEESAPSSHNAPVTTVVEDYTDHPQSPTTMPENLSSGEVVVSSPAIQEYNESKQDATLPSGDNQCSLVHTSQKYSSSFMPPMSGTQSAQFDKSDSQAHDISQLPSFVVHQPIDPTSYYAHIHRSGADSDGHLSSFPSTEVTTKYNGNAAVLPAPNSQSVHEGGVLSTAGTTPLVTQAAGVMQNPIAVTQQQQQQPLPIFRPPSGVHIPHYPPNYVPYGHYFSPFYVTPPAIHQFLGNAAFPQQPPPAVAAAGMKYPLAQFKPGTNAANSTHFVVPGAYGAYGSSPAGGYNPSSATTAGILTSNEDLGAPGPDISSSSFYNLTPQGQHMTFAPTQAGHGTFPGIYHPTQAVTAGAVHPLLQQSQTMAGAVDMVGTGGSVYQQPQHAHINWPGNY